MPRVLTIIASSIWIIVLGIALTLLCIGFFTNYWLQDLQTGETTGFFNDCFGYSTSDCKQICCLIGDKTVYVMLLSIGLACGFIAFVLAIIAFIVELVGEKKSIILVVVNVGVTLIATAAIFAAWITFYVTVLTSTSIDIFFQQLLNQFGSAINAGVTGGWSYYWSYQVTIVSSCIYAFSLIVNIVHLVLLVCLKSRKNPAPRHIHTRYTSPTPVSTENIYPKISAPSLERNNLNSWIPKGQS
jgi:hypothetical protein